MKPVCYARNLPVAHSSITANEILTCKLEPWIHEEEFRYLKTNTVSRQKIGRIKSICLGLPYPKTFKNKDVANRWAAQKAYNERLKRVIQLALRKRISVNGASMRNGEVVISKWDGKKISSFLKA